MKHGSNSRESFSRIPRPQKSSPRFMWEVLAGVLPSYSGGRAQSAWLLPRDTNQNEQDHLRAAPHVTSGHNMNQTESLHHPLLARHGYMHRYPNSRLQPVSRLPTIKSNHKDYLQLKLKPA